MSDVCDYNMKGEGVKDVNVVHGKLSLPLASDQAAPLYTAAASQGPLAGEPAVRVSPANNYNKPVYPQLIQDNQRVRVDPPSYNQSFKGRSRRILPFII